MPQTLLQADQASTIGTSGTLVTDEELRAQPIKLILKGDNNNASTGRIYGIPYTALSSIDTQYINWSITAPAGSEIITMKWIFSPAKTILGTVAFSLEVNEIVVGQLISNTNMLYTVVSEYKEWIQDMVYTMSATIDIDPLQDPVKLLGVSLVRQGAVDTSNIAMRIIGVNISF